MPAGFRQLLIGKTLRNVTLLSLKYALSVGWWSREHFLKLLVKFYLNNTVNIHPLTPHIMPSYIHRTAWPQIPWHQFTACTVKINNPNLTDSWLRMPQAGCAGTHRWTNNLKTKCLQPHLLDEWKHDRNRYYYFASAAVTVDSSHMTASSSASWSRFSPP